MTKEQQKELVQLIEKLEKLSAEPERAHLLADDVLLEGLRVLGASTLANAWEATRTRIGF